MIKYLLTMSKNDIKQFGFGAAWYNVRFMLAWDIASILTGDLKRITTGDGLEDD